MPQRSTRVLIALALLTACSSPPNPGPTPSAPAQPEPAAPAEVTRSAATPVPGVNAPDVTRAAGVEASLSSGLVARAEFPDEALHGFPVVVNLEVRNPTDSPQKCPDFSTRPHLVHFKLTSPTGQVSERFNTPPAFDTGGEWALPPGSRRSVRLEIPSSGGFAAGEWKVTVLAGEPGAVTTFPEKALRLSPARPAGGAAYYDKLIANASGAVFPWVHQAASGFDVYVDHYTPGASGRLLARYHAAHLTAVATPVISRGAPVNARSRHLYWTVGASGLAIAKLEGLGAVARLQSVDMPWPSAVPIARGVTTGRQALAVPLWIPAPRGTGGEVKLLWVDERGATAYKSVADLPLPATRAETAIDAGGNPVLALAHARGIDVYRADGNLPAHLPASGKRAWEADGGWSTAALAFDTHPERGTHPGGLVLIALQLATTTDAVSGGPTTIGRTLRLDLTGAVVDTGAPVPWSGPTEITAVLPDGYGPLRYLARAPDGSAWYGVEGRAPRWVAAKAEGELWPGPTGDTAVLRTIADERVVVDRALALESAP